MQPSEIDVWIWCLTFPFPPWQVRMAFDWAYCQLTAPAEPGASLLQRIVR